MPVGCIKEAGYTCGIKSAGRGSFCVLITLVRVERQNAEHVNQ
jgi:hypothetical protein